MARFGLISTAFRKHFCCCFPSSERIAEDQPDYSEKVTELDYNHCSLREAPSSILDFQRTLERLDLTYNYIAELSQHIFYCSQIKEIDASHNVLCDIPKAVELLTKLTRLDLHSNSITHIPDSLKHCRNLTYLDLSVNQLTEFPAAISGCANLEELLLNDNALESLPESFGNLRKLCKLELRENSLGTLPKSMSRLVKLQRLDIGANVFEVLPQVLGTLKGLTELLIDNNAIHDIPNFIGNLKQLVCLDVSKNEVDIVSKEIAKCDSLADLTLSFNYITVLPDSISNLRNLVTLRIDHNLISNLPNDMGKLSKLQELCASSNKLVSLPETVCYLKKLNTLLLDQNKLKHVPKQIGFCTSLTVLSLGSNELKELPSEISHLKKLKILNVKNNQIRQLPASFVELYSTLGALWLTDEQSRPLMPLRLEIDPESGKQYATCSLLPQLQEKTEIKRKNGEGDQVVRTRSVRKIKFQNVNDEKEGTEITNQNKKVINRRLSSEISGDNITKTECIENVNAKYEPKADSIVTFSKYSTSTRSAILPGPPNPGIENRPVFINSPQQHFLNSMLFTDTNGRSFVQETSIEKRVPVHSAPPMPKIVSSPAVCPPAPSVSSLQIKPRRPFSSSLLSNVIPSMSIGQQRSRRSNQYNHAMPVLCRYDSTSTF